MYYVHSDTGARQGNTVDNAFGVLRLADATNSSRNRIILSTLVLYYKFSCCGSTTGTRGDNLSSVHPEHGKETKHTAGFNVDGVRDANEITCSIRGNDCLYSSLIDYICIKSTGVGTPDTVVGCEDVMYPFIWTRLCSCRNELFVPDAIARSLDNRR